MLSSKLLPLVASVLLAFSLVNAHPGEVEPLLTARELEIRQEEVNARHAVARNCDAEIAAYQAKRHAKRAHLVKKQAYNALQNVCLLFLICKFLALNDGPFVIEYLRTYS